MKALTLYVNQKVVPVYLTIRSAGYSRLEWYYHMQLCGTKVTDIHQNTVKKCRKNLPALFHSYVVPHAVHQEIRADLYVSLVAADTGLMLYISQAKRLYVVESMELIHAASSYGMYYTPLSILERTKPYLPFLEQSSQTELLTALDAEEQAAAKEEWELRIIDPMQKKGPTT